jgi:hypothetical protein
MCRQMIPLVGIVILWSALQRRPISRKRYLFVLCFEAAGFAATVISRMQPLPPLPPAAPLPTLSAFPYYFVSLMDVFVCRSFYEASSGGR